MLRLVLFLLFVALVATGLVWLADRPGTILIDWQGYDVSVSVFHAVVGLFLLAGISVAVWSILRGFWHLPAGLGNFFNRRREKRGLEALSSGLLAIGSGDRSLATRYAVQARKSLPNEPLTHILRAQAAQLAGDRQTARRIFEAMLGSPETEAFGLRGLFIEAEREGEIEAQRQFAERAMKINPKLAWPVNALFDLQCRDGDWASALETLAIAKKNGHVEKPVGERRRAVLLTAMAQKAEDSDPERALQWAFEAHNLAPDLIPATAIAGRVAASRGNVKKATKVLEEGWRKGAHPEIATAYAYARIGDSPRDRLERVKKLAQLSPNSIESPIALASAAIEARDFDVARSALQPLVETGRLTQRACTLMARIEGEDGSGGNVGAVREWLARAVNAQRDPAWTADGVVADDWAPVSPVTGALDAFQWRVPVEAASRRDGALLNEKIEELVKLGVRPETVAATAPVAAAAAGIDEAASDPAAAARVITPSEGKAPAAPPHRAGEPSKPARASADEAEIVGDATEPKGRTAVATPTPVKREDAMTIEPVSDSRSASPERTRGSAVSNGAAGDTRSAAASSTAELTNPVEAAAKAVVASKTASEAATRAAGDAEDADEEKPERQRASA